MLRTTLLVALAVLVVWMGFALVRVENERYALAIGMCRLPNGTADFGCLSKTETRTNPLWHLWHALRE